jgi:hypothetical protein
MGASARVVVAVAVAALAAAPSPALADPPGEARRGQPVEERVATPEPEPPGSISFGGGPRLPVTAPAEVLRPPPPLPFAAPSPVTAGWRDDRFFLSTPNYDWFISPGARLQMDFHMFAPAALSDSRRVDGVTVPSPLRTGFQIRRARIELAGGVLSFLTWQLGAELTDNGPQTAADLLMNFRFRRSINLQVGQFDAPFTMENRTSDRYLDFGERSLAVRALGIPTNKEVGMMLWGEDDSRLLQWSLGVFNGGGPGRFSPGNQAEAMARVFFHPFIKAHPFGLGRSVEAQVAYPAMVTPAGYTLFDPSARGATVVPTGLQWGVAGELVLPLDRFEARAEFVYVRNRTGEVAAAPLARDPVRTGALEGFGVYGQVALWLIGRPGTAPPNAPTATSVRTDALPGYQDPPTLRPARAQPLTLPVGLQLVVRYETVSFAYRAASLSGAPGADDASGRYEVHAVDFGLNLWLTRHARVLLDARHYYFFDRTEAAPGEPNRMRGPAGHERGYTEISARLALNL